jgi:hypothetical protein
MRALTSLKAKASGPGFELQLALVFDQGQVLVVDGDRYLRLVGQCAALFVGLCQSAGTDQQGQEG